MLRGGVDIPSSEDKKKWSSVWRSPNWAKTAKQWSCHFRGSNARLSDRWCDQLDWVNLFKLSLVESWLHLSIKTMSACFTCLSLFPTGPSIFACSASRLLAFQNVFSYFSGLELRHSNYPSRQCIPMKSYIGWTSSNPRCSAPKHSSYMHYIIATRTMRSWFMMDREIL